MINPPNGMFYASAELTNTAIYGIAESDEISRYLFGFLMKFSEN